MKKTIIGIHGLKNKPAKILLESWWIRAIKEGFEIHSLKDISFNFELVYWVDLEYDKPLDPAIKDQDDPYFLKRPYSPFHYRDSNETDRRNKRKILDLIETGMDKLFLQESGFGGLDKIVDIAIRTMFSDLDAYYHGQCKSRKELKAREAFRHRLSVVLNKFPKHEILLLAHSMGSIISYDVLTQVIPKQKIDTFITMGSPLGLPVIIKKILQEQNKKIRSNSKPITPENITRKWLNFSDLDDKVALNYNLSDDYAENSRNIKPIDNIVENQYEYNGQNNPHNVYGYLRTPKVTEEIFEFLNRKNSFLQKILRKLGVK
jgi:PGAP1-like protein